MVSLDRKKIYIKRKYLQRLQQTHLRLQSEHFFLECNKYQTDIYRSRDILLNIFESCQDCKKMATLPQGAFVACKLREQCRERDLIVSRLKKSNGDKTDAKFFNGNKKLLEYSPLKYNEKLMNSIWGFYNRYSPHNIKSNEIVSYNHFYNQQQPSAVANQAIAHNIAMAVTTGKEWNLEGKK